MLVVGLTGGIASGKSTISQHLKGLGAAIIDADQISRDMVSSRSPVLKEIIGYFGADIVDINGQLDRKKLGQRIFDSEQEREKLNSILHPLIFERIQEIIDRYKAEDKVPLIILDAPLLLETGLESKVDEVWVVAVPEDIQIERLMKREGISITEAIVRLNSQMSLAEKIKRADQIIDNTHGLDRTLEEVEKLWQLKRLSRGDKI